MANRKDFQDLRIKLIQEGWVSRLTNGQHHQLIPPFGNRIVIMSSTPGRGRAYQNALSDVRRVYKLAGKEPPV